MSAPRLWGTFLLLCVLLAVTGAGKQPLDAKSKKPPPPTNGDIRSLRQGRHATVNAALNGVVLSPKPIKGLRCVSVLDPQLLEEDLDAVQRSSMQSVILDEYLYHNNREDETALCDELLVPFEFEDAWFLAWYKRGKLNFLAEEDLVEEPIGKKVAQAVRMLYPQHEITAVKPQNCERSKEMRKLGDGAFIGHQAMEIILHDTLPASVVCNGREFDESTAFMTRIGLMMKFPKVGPKYLSSLPKPEFDKTQPDQVFMLKLVDGFKTRTFSDGKWGPEIDFEETFVSELFNRCIDPDLKDAHQCHEHFDGDSPGGKSVNLANGVFIDKVTDDDLAESWFCAHSWSGYGHSCLLKGGASCFRNFKNTTRFTANQDAFVCKRLPKICSFLLRVYITGLVVPIAGSPPLLDLDDHFIFSELTRLKVVLQKPLQLAESIRELLDGETFLSGLFLQEMRPTDVYMQLANSTGEVFMVMAKSDPKSLRDSKIDADGVAVNVLTSLHPLFSNPNTDSTKIAFNVPKDKVHGPFWVCLGDFSRERHAALHAGGTYCIQDEALNRDFRCSSVVGPIVREDRTGKRRFVFADIEDIPYEEWYSDCPKTARNAVLQEVERILESPRKYHAVGNHPVYAMSPNEADEVHDEL